MPKTVLGQSVSGPETDGALQEIGTEQIRHAKRRSLYFPSARTGELKNLQAGKLLLILMNDWRLAVMLLNLRR